MKKYFILFVIAIAALVSCTESEKGKNGVTYKTAVQYNDYIVNRQTTLIKYILEFSKMADSNLDSAGTALKKYARQAEQMIDEVKGMPAYKGDSSLRNAAVHSFTFYKKLFELDYADLLNLRKKNTVMSGEDVVEANRIVDKIGKEEEVLDKGFHNAQKTFAKENKITLMDNKVQQEINEAKKE